MWIQTVAYTVIKHDCNFLHFQQNHAHKKISNPKVPKFKALRFCFVLTFLFSLLSKVHTEHPVLSMGRWPCHLVSLQAYLLTEVAPCSCPNSLCSPILCDECHQIYCISNNWDYHYEASYLSNSQTAVIFTYQVYIAFGHTQSRV